MAKKRKSRRDEPVTLYREGQDPMQTLGALLEVPFDKSAEGDDDHKEEGADSEKPHSANGPASGD